MGRLTPYGKAWYVNPELWGLESSQVESAILDQEDDNAEGKTWKRLRFPGHQGVLVLGFYPGETGN